ncbi:hypothetical protein V502_01265 [Pseudogymnoascus sp. VKM F-4520 (FW-2644)]|nr:hypothetical protein V502_01265 [Pseudogymnoascus sp. VKM F-4520 (FW-2644)]
MRVASLFVIAALPALSLAQSVDSLSSEVPFCALGPLSIAAGENNCNMDATCLCKDQTFVTSLTKKVEAACSKEELDKVVSLATSACKTAGVTIAVPVDNSTDSSAANPSWGERSSTVNLVMVVGVMGLVAQALL